MEFEGEEQLQRLSQKCAEDPVINAVTHPETAGEVSRIFPQARAPEDPVTESHSDVVILVERFEPAIPVSEGEHTAFYRWYLVTRNTIRR